MLISLECTMAHTRMGYGRVIFPNKGLMREQNVFLMTKSRCFKLTSIISGYSASYFIEMFMLISLEYILVQTRMWFCRVRGP